MIGLVVVATAAIYVALLVWTTRAVYRWAKRQGWSTVRCRWAATGGLSVLALPIFWDFVPTVVVNSYYCHTIAGFTAFKTLEQWRDENSAIADSLVLGERSRLETLPDGTQRYFLNTRMIFESRKVTPVPILSTMLFEEKVVDAANGQVLAKDVTVGAGYANPLVASSDWRGFKMWLDIGTCREAAAAFTAFHLVARKMGEKR